MRSLCEAYQLGINIRNDLHETDIVTAFEDLKCPIDTIEDRYPAWHPAPFNFSRDGPRVHLYGDNGRLVRCIHSVTEATTGGGYCLWVQPHRPRSSRRRASLVSTDLTISSLAGGRTPPTRTPSFWSCRRSWGWSVVGLPKAQPVSSIGAARTTAHTVTPTSAQSNPRKPRSGAGRPAPSAPPRRFASTSNPPSRRESGRDQTRPLPCPPRPTRACSWGCQQLSAT